MDQYTITEIKNTAFELKVGKPGYLNKILDLNATQKDSVAC